jgi:hypothetical protein
MVAVGVSDISAKDLVTAIAFKTGLWIKIRLRKE